MDPAAIQSGYGNGAGDTFATGINGGKIVGSFRRGGGAEGGFMYDGSTWTTLIAPGASETYPSAISGNTIVGTFWDGANLHGFAYDGSSWTTLDSPSSTYNTRVTGIYGSDIVGYYNLLNGNGRGYGFLYDGSTWTTIDDPLATNGVAPDGVLKGTAVTAISGDVVVGYYTDSLGNSPHGFIATVPEPPGFVILFTAFASLFLSRRFARMYRRERRAE
jgi:hypothetical protein